MSTSPSTSQPQPQPQPDPDPTTKPDLTPAYRTFQHYTALGFLFGAPVLIALPPRKLDIYTFGLGSSWVLSANHLYRERRRRLQQQQLSPFGGLAVAEAGSRAEKAKQDAGLATKSKSRYEIVQEQLRREKEDDRKGGRRLLELPPDGEAPAALNEQQEQEDGEAGRSKSRIERQLEKVWMGGEKAGWKQRRLAEEREKISQGEGYGGMIMDQIWEVWNWGKEKGEEKEEKDREVLRERRRREEFPEIGKGGNGA